MFFCWYPMFETNLILHQPSINIYIYIHIYIFICIYSYIHTTMDITCISNIIHGTLILLPRFQASNTWPSKCQSMSWPFVNGCRSRVARGVQRSPVNGVMKHGWLGNSYQEWRLLGKSSNFEWWIFQFGHVLSSGGYGDI